MGMSCYQLSTWELTISYRRLSLKLVWDSGELSVDFPLNSVDRYHIITTSHRTLQTGRAHIFLQKTEDRQNYIVKASPVGQTSRYYICPHNSYHYIFLFQIQLHFSQNSTDSQVEGPTKSCTLVELLQSSENTWKELRTSSRRLKLGKTHYIITLGWVKTQIIIWLLYSFPQNIKLS